MLDFSIYKNSIKLGVFACITIGLCVVTFNATKERVALEKRKAMRSALLEVLPANRFNNRLVDDTQLVDDARLGHKEPSEAYIARMDGEPVAAVIPVAAREGYGGTINLLVSILFDGTLSGVRVVPPHPETPGLGDGIEAKKSDWILSFNGKSLQNPAPINWKVTKDGGQFDVFTGATITPRAVVKSVYQTLEYFKQNKADLFAPTVNELEDTIASNSRNAQ